MKWAAITMIIFGFALGCSSAPKYTQAQLNAIESREVDADVAATFNAASGALFDAGYTIAMSDRQAGLITGTKADSKQSERIWISAGIEDVHFAVSIQIREAGPKRSIVRVKTSVNGEPRVDKKAIDEIWVLMQRQVLMKEPLPTEPA
jgi:hypothetical protein